MARALVCWKSRWQEAELMRDQEIYGQEMIEQQNDEEIDQETYDK